MQEMSMDQIKNHLVEYGGTLTLHPSKLELEGVGYARINVMQFALQFHQMGDSLTFLAAPGLPLEVRDGVIHI